MTYRCGYSQSVGHLVMMGVGFLIGCIFFNIIMYFLGNKLAFTSIYLVFIGIGFFLLGLTIMIICGVGETVLNKLKNR